MKYTDIDDNELYYLVCEENEEAKDILFLKYKYIIDLLIKKYAFAGMKYGLEYKDLYQEGLVGYADAIKSYQEGKNATLATFITRCVNRRLQKTIRNAKRTKNMFLLDSLSLDYTDENNEIGLLNVLSDNKYNPLVSISLEEDFDYLLEEIKKSLSPSEYEVYKLLVSGLNSSEISSLLQKTSKQIDNAMQRIKNKIKNILKTRENT